MMHKSILLSLGALAAVGLTSSCGINGGIIDLPGCGNTFYTLQLGRQNIGINERVPVSLFLNNPCNHDLEFRFLAQRGQVLVLGLPESVDRVESPSAVEAAWWYYAAGRVARFRDGRLIELQSFDPIRPLGEAP